MKLDLIKSTLKITMFWCGMVLLSSIAIYGQDKGVRASQKASVSQRVAKTEITIDYSRPSAKGRVLFGPDGIIEFGEIWMPGANEASYIKISDDVFLNGKQLSAGSYSIWTIPGEDKWTIILSTDWEQWHTQYPGEDKDAIRFSVKPIEGSHMELLTFYFPAVAADSAVLNFHWGKTILPFEIKLVEKKIS